MLRPCAGFQRSFLPLLYFQPVDKAVDVVDKKYEKAYCYGYIRYIRQRSQDPEYDQHNIVRRIGKREQGTAFIGQPDGDKARCDRNCARHHVRRMKCVEYEVKNKCDKRGHDGHPQNFPAFQPVYPDLRPVPVIRMFLPCDPCENSHGRRHAQICYHFAAIGECIGYHAV